MSVVIVGAEKTRTMNTKRRVRERDRDQSLQQHEARPNIALKLCTLELRHEAAKSSRSGSEKVGRTSCSGAYKDFLNGKREKEGEKGRERERGAGEEE